MESEDSVKKPTNSHKKGPILNRLRLKYHGIKKDLFIKGRGLLVNDDVKSLVGITFDVVSLGILSNLGLMLFGFNFNIYNVLATGSILWLVQNKLKQIVVDIFNSIKPINIYR